MYQRQKQEDHAMAKESSKSERAEMSGSGCDVKVWSGSCERSEYSNPGEKYLCTSCGKIAGLDHEVHHEVFPHVCGDEDNLS
jgi:hypothetical protein